MKRFGYGDGSLSRAAQEAFENWIVSVEEEKVEFKGDPVRVIMGLLMDMDVDSVWRQHK